jgi:hypothetical protein
MTTLALCGATASAPAYAEDARTLPKGRSRFSFAYGHAPSITQTFDNNGQAVSVTKDYNFELSKDMISKLDGQFSALVGILNSTGMRYDVARREDPSRGITTDDSKPLVGDALSRGFLGVAAQAEHKQYNLMLFHGVTDRLSVGFMVPYIQETVRVDHSITGANTASDIYNGFIAKDPALLGELQKFPAALNFIQNANDETFQGLLADRDYDRFGNYNGSGIGDVVLGGRYSYLNKNFKVGEVINAFQVGTTLPTGKVRPPRNLTEQSRGQGYWDIGAAHIFNITPTRLVTLSQGLHYTWSLPGRRIMRVRENPDDFVPNAASEENVRTWYGDKYWATAAAKLNVSSAINFEASYEWWKKNSDRFAGDRPKDYEYMSDKTDQYKETFSISASVSSIPAFKAYDFPLPGEFSASYNLPTRGKNAVIAPYWTAELALYF